ncbi:hypothetical protein evm_006294 [Chilo suppressalis]|nr:hypothetical protein evm_006294 [Chilo suppressalis]
MASHLRVIFLWLLFFYLSIISTVASLHTAKPDNQRRAFIISKKALRSVFPAIDSKMNKTRFVKFKNLPSLM